MCGFAGYKSFQNKNVDHQLLVNLAQILQHRGPDGSGVWICQNNHVGLVSTRLSIVDITQAGAQPMTDQLEQVILVYNGEIYNFEKIRLDLENKGYIFKSKTDTEVLLYAYKEWGIDCLRYFEGMFAGVIYDKRSDRMILFRDRIGKKPLYFSFQSDTISFASEIKALWLMPWIVRNYSISALSHYLTYLATPAPMTLFEGIYKLPAGFYAEIKMNGESRFVQWYDPLMAIDCTKSNDYKKKSWCVASIRTLIKNTVHKRLSADVPVGALLSGGLDSSLIVACMAEVQSNIETFTISFDNDEQEERAWARKIAKKYKTNHHELILNEQEAFAFFHKMIYYQDEPLGDSVCIPLYFVSKLARDTGIKVLLSGEGADELFCGYPSYVQYLDLYKYWKFSQTYFPSLIKKTIFYAARPFYTDYPNRADLIKSWADQRDLFWGGVRVFSPIWKNEFLKAGQKVKFDPIIEKIYPGFPQKLDSYDIADFYRAKFYEQYKEGDFFSAMTYIELKHRLPELLLARTDKMSMAASVEIRVPFLDHLLVECALQIPMKFKYRNKETKFLLKKVAEGFLPYETIYRKKVGFISPVTKWFKEGIYFKEHMYDMIHSNNPWNEILNIKAVEELLIKNNKSTIDYSYQLWALNNLLAF